ncbi:MAG: hypothetical protein KDD82_10000 [Planctomycetes bacterium]|nr:hypothetical protein [Planctomycetota bacterium]
MTRKRSQRMEALTGLRVSEEAARRTSLAQAQAAQALRERELGEARGALQAAERRLTAVLGRPSLDLVTLQRARADLEALHQLERRVRIGLREVTRLVNERARELEAARVARRAAEELTGRASSEERLIESRAEARSSDEAALLRWERGSA